AVILLTSLGEGTRLYMLNQFAQFGTNLVSVNPGKVETSGVPGALGGTVRSLTLEDGAALARLRGVAEVVPVVMGTATVKSGGRERGVYIYGVTGAATRAWKMGVRTGRFLPDGDPRHGAPLAVLGPTVRRELFGDGSALGEHVRIAGQRFTVIGVMESKGQLLGFDIDDAVYIPVAQALRLFNREELQEIHLLAAHASAIDSVAARVRATLRERHGGVEDFTVTTQTGMIETLDRILRIVSLAVAGIGAISLLVGAIGILTMMWISVHERTEEIGLAKALGATQRQILLLFLAEAALLSTAGGLAGLLGGLSIAGLLGLALPGLPVKTPPEYVVMALALSLAVGLASGILPARRAARLDPIAALASE
ncbi:MAG: ABC transporter permease, partial [Candidatus Eisenbacteria bacterium]|nr:ABC transporter permease [Candidatus Eisenbacteria bacterium]